MKVKLNTIFKVFLTVLCVLFFTVNYSTAQCLREPLQEAIDVMAGDAEVAVSTVTVGAWTAPDNYYHEFTPTGTTPSEALILYTGGTVDERAYAPMARDIAAAGYLVALVASPNCLPIVQKERVDDIITAHPEIEKWSIGGHSFGGVVAAMYIDGSYTHSDKIDGLVFWASYPANNAMLSVAGLQVISIYGISDGITELIDIENSIPNLPADTRFVALEGANHTQFGWYGENATDYDFLQPGQEGELGDNLATLTRQEQQDLIVSYTTNFLDSLTPDTLNIPAAEDEVIADDGSVWETVSLNGFADINNTDIVSLTPYKGNLYALTRNDVSGFELWKTNPAQGWQRIHAQGFTDQSNYSGYLKYGPTSQYNPNMNIWADMIEFKGYLYVAVSTGYQGRALFGSRGAIIWRTDGVEFEPVIGGHDPDEQGTLTAIASCHIEDGSRDGISDGTTTAVFTDSTQAWATNSLAGCFIEVESEFTEFTHAQTGVIVPGRRVFQITANTPAALTVQQSEDATITDQTRCAEYLKGGGDPGRPFNRMSRVVTGAAYTITCGDHARGFGDPWNKSIIDFEILNDVLYASIGLNYSRGARIMRTSDGLTWVPDSPYSFDNIHGEDWHDGSAIAPEDCAVIGGTMGTPVSSSLTKMIKTSITGEETLLIGGTGTTGCNGRGARIYRRDGDQLWTPIVDVLVDGNTSGTNENGFGYLDPDPIKADLFFYSAFQAWSWLEYDATLLVGLVKLEAGGMIFSTPDAAETDGAWEFSMGGVDRVKSTPGVELGYADSSAPDPDVNGFGDVLNTGVYLHNYNDTIYAGTMVTNLSVYFLDPLNGADLWKGTGPGDDITWSRIVGDGFGDLTVLQFQSFVDYATQMYMVASTVNPSNFRGQEPAGYTGAKVYRMVSDGSCSDTDADGVCDDVDNCPDVANPGQENVDAATEIDILGDVCDPDTVYGTVSGDVLEGINIELYTESCGEDILEATTTTDQYGYYALGGLSSQRYLIYAEKTGFNIIPQSGWVDIPNAVGQSFDFTATSE